jgi:hypothetical protein
MKRKKEYFILAAAAVVLILYLVMHQSDRTHYELPTIPKTASKQITKLEIDKGSNSIVLEKKDNSWYIEPKEFPADSEKIKEMLDVIEGLTLTALISESKNYARYDLNADKKIGIKAWVGGDLGRDFEVGKPAPTYRHTHVMLAGDANVYHARGDFRRKFDLTVDNLRDKKVLSFQPDDIQEIAIVEDDETMVLQLKDVTSEEKEEAKDSADEGASQSGEDKKRWEIADGKKVDASKLKGLLSSLSQLKCEKYIDDAEKADLKDSLYELKLKGAKAYTLSIFKKGEKETEGYPAVSSENKFPFLLSDAQVDNIKTNLKEMVPEAQEEKAEK